MATNDGEIKLDGRRARGDRSRALVLDRAVAIAAVEGLEGLTFGRLANDAGVSKGNLTVLFGDKESLQLAAIDFSVDHMIKSFIEPSLSRESAFERLYALCEGWFAWVEKRSDSGGCFMYATTHEYRARSGPLHDRTVSNFTQWHKLLARQLRKALARGEVKADTDVDRAILTLISYQNTAHLASTIDDRSMFTQMRQLSLDYLESLRSASQ